MNEKQIAYPIADRWAYFWLLLAMLFGIFSISIGKWVIPIAAWLGPIFVLRFMRSQRRVWLGYVVLSAATAAATAVALPDILGDMSIPIIIGSAIIANLAPLADRLLVPRLPGFVATLVFPLAYTALEYINSATNPLGSFGMQAYSQYNNLALLQLVSLTGMWGISFLMSWLASTVNWAWERDFAWSEIKRGVTLYAGILFLVVLFGQVRLWFAPPAEDTVRVAGIVPVDFRESQGELMTAISEDWETFRQMSESRAQLYFMQTVKEAQAGAKIILWPEFALPVAKEDEAAMIEHGQDIARQEGIYLAMSMGTMYTDETPYEQKMLVIDPSGAVVIEHYKYGGTGMEGNRFNGDGILRTADTPFGVLSGVICWDTDFPSTVIQSGRNGTDILLSPSLDARGITPIHGTMSVLRAIENGVSVVRVGDNGLSIISDPYGRTLATMDHFSAGERVIIAQVPVQGVSTIYPVVGDLFGWLAILGFVVITIVAIVRWRRAKSMTEPVTTAEELAPTD